MTEKFTQSSLNQTPEQAAKEYANKIRDLEKIAYNKGYMAGSKFATLSRGILK